MTKQGILFGENEYFAYQRKKKPGAVYLCSWKKVALTLREEKFERGQGEWVGANETAVR